MAARDVADDRGRTARDGPRLTPVTRSDSPDGVRVDAATYSATFLKHKPFLRLADAAGVTWLELALASSVDTRDGLDETTTYARPAWREALAGLEAIVEVSSIRWQRRALHLRFGAEELGVGIEVEGEGALTEVRIGGGYDSSRPDRGTGFSRSLASFSSVFNPEPGAADRFATPAATGAAVDIVTGASFERGHWFFTPAPFCFAFSRGAARPGGMPAGPWLSAGLATRPGEEHFTGFHYEVDEEEFCFRLAYEGQTSVHGTWSSPELRFSFGAADAYAAIAAYRESLERDGLAPVAPWRLSVAASTPPVVARTPGVPAQRATSVDPRPAWWRRPLFCGWGAQVALAIEQSRSHPDAPPGRASDFATQARYDQFLAELAAHGLKPPTIVIDDKWQQAYGTNAPDSAKWPDIRGWIAQRHAAGQRVLLWWKAWDAEGLPAEECVRRGDGAPVTVDPSNPAYATRVSAIVEALVAPHGLDADGFKIDFTGKSPSGPGLDHHGPEWGAALLHRLLELIYRAAKAAKPDALVITHAPNPSFADVADMLRLNDTLRLDAAEPWPALVPQMQHRARIVAAACPDLLIDTDDWAMPDLASFRAYLAVQASIGVPSLYYSSRIDLSQEPLEEQDYAALRALWHGPGSGDL